jgi:nitroreductase
MGAVRVSSQPSLGRNILEAVMEFLEAVGSRRSIRWFLPSQPVERDKIQRILEAARLTSCPGNLQPWRAIVVVASEADEGDRETLLAAGNRQRPHVLAPVWIYWYADPAGVAPAGFLGRIRELLPAGALAPGVGWTEDAVRRSILEGEPSPPGMPALERLVHDLPAEASAFIAAQETNGACVIAVLAAVNEGLGTCLHSIATPDRHEDVKRVLGVPEHWVPVWLQLVGYPAEDPAAGGQRPRMPFEQLFAAGRWGTHLSRDLQVVEDLTAKRLLQAPGPVPGRFEELEHLTRTLGGSEGG